MKQDDVIPDFSWCGYRGGGVSLPDAPVRVTLQPTETGDDGARIQAALNQVSRLPANPSGVRGAVLLARGNFRVAGSLVLPSGVVLRGEGQDAAGGTTILATGTAKRTLIKVGGDGKHIKSRDEASRQAFLDERVPCGARKLRIANPKAFRVGERVLIERPSTAAWIAAIGMDKIVPRPGDPALTKQWTPGKYDFSFERVITGVDEATITIDAPVVMAMEKRYGGGSVCRYEATGRVEQAGVEKLRLRSEYKAGEEDKDDDHAGMGVDFGLASDCWMQNVTALHFTGGCMATSNQARRLTIQDCACLDPVSQIIPSRRYSFGVRGQQVLVQRCYTRGGRHDFMTGYQAHGPNAFVDCLAEETHADSGPHNGWSTGVLYDNIVCGTLYVQDRGYMGTGQGWAGANHVFYNCTGTIICQTPPTAKNWAMGCTGTKGKEFLKREPGTIESWGKPVSPRSLYLRQLEERLGPQALKNTVTPEQLKNTLTEALRRRYAEPKASIGLK
jgi:hypothetical protein